MLNVDSASVYTDFNGLAKLKQGARDQSPEAIKEVAKQFESLFLNMVMKSMRQAKLADGILDSQQGDFFRDMYDQQMAVQLAGKPGIGLADLIAKQLSPKQSEDGEKLQAGDYLNRAAAGRTVSPLPSMQIFTAKQANVEPISASGLDSLERILARLDAGRQAVADDLSALDECPFKSDNDQPITSKQDFIERLLPHARQAASELGVDAHLLLAQAALETGWGQSVIKNGQGESSFNLFNIKADKSWQGKQAKTTTLEFEGGIARKELAGFRSYASYGESFDDYVKFIKSNPRYSEALKKTGNAAQYVRELQQAGYATDPRYAEKVMTIHKQLNAAAQANLG